MRKKVLKALSLIGDLANRNYTSFIVNLTATIIISIILQVWLISSNILIWVLTLIGCSLIGCMSGFLLIATLVALGNLADKRLELM